MTCYAVPTTAAIVHFLLSKKIPSWKKDKYHSWLNLLLAGGAIFGVVDHMFNAELFLFSIKDLILGLAITLSILTAWVIMVYYDKLTTKSAVSN